MKLPLTILYLFIVLLGFFGLEEMFDSDKLFALYGFATASAFWIVALEA